MALISPILRSASDNLGNTYITFWCPGCNEAHSVCVARPDGNQHWHWDSNVDRPTLSPSILVRSGHYLNPEHCWCRFNEERAAKGEEPTRFACRVCHSFVRDGRIEFLSDCTHHLAGQTVDIPDWPEDYSK